MTRYHALEQWLSWMDELSEKDFVVIDPFLKTELLAEIRAAFSAHLTSFTKAGIGAAHDFQIRHDVRGDYTYWLDRKRDTDMAGFWSLIDETMHVFNRYCYLSLSGHEFHFATYPPGARYEKHLDQFDSRTNRMITLVIYLNEGWQKGDGGELEVFLKSGESVIIEPLDARCVMFKSAEVPHRVLESHKNRKSLTGWLLHQPAGLGQLFG
ncbi:2OG-Fe(II) oxygenase [Muriicola sp.]|uniref:2OG-Fe(II) oxygenase n=1 Tax=Muriicola sp. TaxID=2020856 RepID=UPI00356AAD81